MARRSRSPASAGRARGGCRPEVQALRVGRTMLVGLPMEPFVSYASRLRSEVGEDAYLNGYTNGWLGYLPHEADLDRGGYQVDWAPIVYGHTVGMPTRIAAGEPSRISSEAAGVASSLILRL